MKTLEQAFLQHVNDLRLFRKTDRLLLALSGGLDSMVCANLLQACGFPFEAAHVNFQLRGAESDSDEAFVRRWAAEAGIPLHVSVVDTRQYMEEQRLSMQEAARKWRYQYFEQIRQTISGQPFTCIITAHHADDQAETVLLHLLRGSGIAGLSGIPASRDRYRRPLLFARRAVLEAYATEKGVRWVDDSSNSKTDYARNRMRHEVIPVLEKAFPGAVEGLVQSAAHLADQKALYHTSILRLLNRHTVVEGAVEKMPVLLLLRREYGPALFFEWLHGKGWLPGEIDSAWKLVDSQSGAYTTTAGYRLLRHREWLLLQRLPIAGSSIYLLEEKEGKLAIPGFSLTWRTRTFQPGETVPSDANLAWLDTRHIEYPLQLRRFKTGDYFYPLGMPAKKKLARFMTDIRMNRFEKEEAWLVESDRRITWLAGKRIDHRFRVTENTKEILELKWEKVSTGH